jgi:hypothetical protein
MEMNITEEALEFSKAHIINFYDSDFFRKPFEFKAINANWDEIKSFYLSMDRYTTNNLIKMAAPKPKGGFRVVHQLDPLDCLLYTALTYQIANFIEMNRADKEVACSYRICTNTGGNFFADGHGYDLFERRCIEMADNFHYTLVTDLTDFYNQIYLHRLQNNIEYCDKELNSISKALEEFLININVKVSKGVPVGPASSIVLAEAIFIDIDEYIIKLNPNYVRYVDDIVIFSDSKLDLMWLLHQLTIFLYDNHRLNLSASKTRILESTEYIDSIQNPDKIEANYIHKELETFQVRFDYTYIEPELDDLSTEDKTKVRTEALCSFMQKIIDLKPLDLGLARHILRKCRRLRTRAIINQLLSNFDFFVPVLPDVILYLEKVTNDTMLDHNMHHFENIVINSKTKNYPWVKDWLQKYFIDHYNVFSTNKTINSYINSGDIRILALKARKERSIAWLRDKKTSFDHYGPWDRRALIYAGTLLPSEEKKHWMDSIIGNSNNLLDRVVAKYVKNL